MPDQNLAQLYAQNIDLSGKDFEQLSEPQKEAVRGVVDTLADGHMRVLVVMPTQTGKTGVYLYIIDQLRKNGVLDQALAMTPYTHLAKAILDDEIPKFASTIHEDGVAQKLNLQEGMWDTDLAVAAYAGGTTALLDDEIIDKDRIGLIALDEAHMALSDRRQQALRGVPSAVEIAVTASPNYSQRKNLENEGYVEAYHLTVKKSVERGFSAELRNVLVELEDFEGSLDDVSVDSTGDYSIQELDKLLMQEAVIQAGVNVLKNYQDPITGRHLTEGTGIVFCNGINHARAWAERANQEIDPSECGDRIPCAAIWGEMPKKEKDNLIARHKSGEIMVLANADMLIHGYANSDVDFILNGKPTRSGVVAEQRPGRAIGLPVIGDGLGKKLVFGKRATVLDLVFPANRNHQLLYGDVVGGYLFEHSSSSPATNSSHQVNLHDLPVFHGIRFHYSEEEVLNFVSGRERQKRLNSNPHMLRYAPLIREAMMDADLKSFRGLWGKIRDIVREHDLDKSGGNTVSEASVRELVYGRELPFKENWKEYTLTATVVAAAMGKRPEAVYGHIPDGTPMRAFQCNKLFAPDYAYPIDYDWTPEETIQAERLGVMFTDDPAFEAALRTEQYNTYISNAKGSKGQIKIRAKDGVSRFPDYRSVADATDLYDETELAETLNRVLSSLTPREDRVLRMRYGLGNGVDFTLEEVGKMFSVPRERIRQIEAKALRKLKHPARSRKLRTFLPDETPAYELIDLGDHKKSGALRASHPSAVNRDHERQRQSILDSLNPQRVRDGYNISAKLEEEKLEARSMRILLDMAHTINAIPNGQNPLLDQLEEAVQREAKPINLSFDIPKSFFRKKRGVILKATFRRSSSESGISLAVEKVQNGKVTAKQVFEVPKALMSGAKAEIYEADNNRMVVDVASNDNMEHDVYELDWLLDGYSEPS